MNGTANEVYGLGKSLAVKPGDVVDAEVWAKYLDPVTKGKAGSAFAHLVQDLSDKVSSVVVDGVKATTTSTMPFAGLIDRGSEDSDVPKAYLNMLVFDRNYKLINSGFKQIGKQAAEDGSDVSRQYLNTGPMTVTEPGFVYIYPDLGQDRHFRMKTPWKDRLFFAPQRHVNVQIEQCYPLKLEMRIFIEKSRV